MSYAEGMTCLSDHSKLILLQLSPVKDDLRSDWGERHLPGDGKEGSPLATGSSRKLKLNWFHACLV